MASSIAPGLVALHGNCTETLADTLMAWMQAHPLEPLEQETVLVQSNGTAEWFKMRMAEQLGVCAAAKVELPARFIWRTYRQVLGKHEVPPSSPLEKIPLTWRLMRLLPACLHAPAFAPIANFLRPGEPERLLQLAERLADLFDQYQIYRSDWLDAWQAGRDVLPQTGKPDQTIPAGQMWQPQLWRAVLADLTESEKAATRTALQALVLQRLRETAPGALVTPRRVVLFGLSHVPLAMLGFMDALSRHSQVVLAVPNPCRYHWADAIDGRDLLRMQRRRQPLKNGQDLAAVPLESMHTHAHPLLAAWGRQSRDYVRLLDAFDTTLETANASIWPRVDLFDDTPADQGTLLQQVQRSMRDLLPLSEHPRTTQPGHHIPASDGSIVFHSTHSLVRELEVLHDQLLHMLAQPAAAGQVPLQPRDVIVMLPDIEKAAPSIRAVFGQYGRTDARYIPFDIADLSARAASPMVVALQWLLCLPQQRCRLSELCDLLDVPAIAARFGLAAQDVPQLTQWMAGAGIRWGLNSQQRESLGLGSCGEHNSAWFGLRRMLLGYASGSRSVQTEAGLQQAAAWAEIEPYDEVGGLDAQLAGVLAAVLERLMHWWNEALQEAVPDVWAQRLRQLAQDMFDPQDEVEQALLDGLEQSLSRWQSACEEAAYAQPIPLAVAQEAWLQALEQPSLEQRFRAGGVTFSTPMPMRAIPFEVVCLLGMNDGDYPRRAARNDFDLMQQSGQYRPGDRARRDHDRQLMLDAVLSARRTLYISWAGHHVRDNSEQPASVLVSQLREYLAAGWRGEQDLLQERTWSYPLQPFSRRYFEVGAPLTTYASEWRAAHAQALQNAPVPEMPAFVPDPQVPLTVAQLTAFVRNPAKAFFRERLSVHFEQDDSVVDDDEVFQLDGLQAYGLVQELQQQFVADWEGYGAPRHTNTQYIDGDATAQLLQARIQSLQRAGRLPLAGLGEREAQQLQATLLPGLRTWQQLRTDYPLPAERQRLHFTHQNVVLQDWLDQLWLPSAQSAGVLPIWLLIDPRDVLDAKRQPRRDRLLPVYIRSLVAAACGAEVQGMVVGRDACLHVQPMDEAEARSTLQTLLQLWVQGHDQPLPLPAKTGLALAMSDLNAAVSAYEGGFKHRGECEDMSWQRLFPDYAALAEDGQLEPLAQSVYAPMHAWCASSLAVVDWTQDLAQGAPA
ncbi:exodeoxyribonuclease V subunit gamma [Comamonas sp. CMM02]|uniref:exodeoxyribonuclease V subunit gamma n=1 Tax=Comamonas sp. CMM02 TaxID=2769307 RepID=UPI00177E864F|nr:exodeoxyribonuclease V subunit gamma [Comamonas sp. CMM02]MBD9403528.1 exodeoxyribonuclease V subunit gamma [Comamonas sp. CMM02]